MAAISALRIPATGHCQSPLRPPVRNRRFWIVQTGVLSVALLHDFVLVDLPERPHTFGVADAMTSALLIIPVIYAALNFGVHGSVATSLWATALISPHWLAMNALTSDHLLIEAGNLAVLNIVAIVVGQRVERERCARVQAEQAAHLAQTASARYQGLFDQQPAPVIIADSTGTVVELNTAADRFFGRGTRTIQDLLGVQADDFLNAHTPYLRVRGADGNDRIFMPSAHRLEVGEDEPVLQIVLTDVTEQHRRQEEQRLFSSRLLAVQEQERQRLARELHDEPVQNLVYLTRALEDLTDDPDVPNRLLPTIRRSGEVAVTATSALRKVIQGLRPPLLDNIGLVPALRHLVEDVHQRGELAVQLRCTALEDGLSPELRLTVYRIVQEALNNVLRHADARQAWVKVRFGDALTVEISDDGNGLPAKSRSDGLGITGMRERATMAGGTLRVSRRSPRGTVVRAALPLPHTTEARAVAEPQPLPADTPLPASVPRTRPSA